jgi:hypothetical protein
MLDADARGGVELRTDRLQACLAHPKNDQKGTLSLKIGIDSAGSVSYSKATGGDLKDTPLGACLLAVFYKMGFAAPPSTAQPVITATRRFWIFRSIAEPATPGGQMST